MQEKGDRFEIICGKNLDGSEGGGGGIEEGRIRMDEHSLLV